LINKEALDNSINSLIPKYGEILENDRVGIHALYEKVYNHEEFTGRSGGMFGFEGLGSTYWHMVSKLLLAVQECYFSSLKEENASVSEVLKEYYYRVREGFGFNKSCLVFGAFPTDPYSHSPSHSGAKQPGMTGSVKEEILTRFGELGIVVKDASITFMPKLLRQREFLDENVNFTYYDISAKKHELEIMSGSLAFTWCQVPIIYELNNEDKESILIHWQDGKQELIQGNKLCTEISDEIFKRSEKIQKLIVTVPANFIAQ
jgi:hypothetical protein